MGWAIGLLEAVECLLQWQSLRHTGFEHMRACMVHSRR